MRRVHICDPQLVGVGGHYLSHDAQLVRDLQRRNVPVSIYARRGCELLCEGLAPAPVFSNDIFQEVSVDAQVWAIENFHAVNQAFLGDLCKIDAEQFAAEDLVYFPNLLQNQLHAVSQWLQRLPSERRPAVAVMLRFLNHDMEYMRARAHRDMIAWYYRYAAQELVRVQPRSFLCADTRELAAAYREMTGQPVLELPNPMDVSSLGGRPQDRPADERPLIVYQGGTSPQRGFGFLPEIIERCAKLNPRPRFMVQVQSVDAARALNLGAALEHLERLEGEDLLLVKGPLDPDDYLGWLAASDIVLLPYSPHFYGHGSSGVFTESASLGKVLVVSPGTVPARQGKEYALGVVTAAQWTPQAMAEATTDAVRRLPALNKQAAEAAQRFRRENCAQALWDKLLGAAFPPAARALGSDVRANRGLILRLP